MIIDNLDIISNEKLKKKTVKLRWVKISNQYKKIIVNYNKKTFMRI